MGERNRLQIQLILCAGLGLALLLAGIAAFLWTASPTLAQGDEGDETPPPPEVEITLDASADTVETAEPGSGDNSYCAVCHSQQGRVMTLADGSLLDLYVSPQVIADSVHGRSEHASLGCVDCHTEEVFPHSGPSPESARAYRIEASALCSDCHNEVLADSAHLEAIAAGNLQAATCVDCHGAHDVPATEDQPTLVSNVCGDCHTNTFEEWSQSPHANMGSLGCAVCHLPHGQQLRIENTNQLCLTCHKVPSDIAVHEQHLNSEYDVTCASCHMSLHPTISLVSESEPIDHRMAVETRSCVDCHQELQASGDWDALTGGSQQIEIERDALRRQVATLEHQVSARNVEEAGGGVDYVQLIQGLIVGLGLAVIALLIIVPRLNRGSGTDYEEVEESHPENDRHE